MNLTNAVDGKNEVVMLQRNADGSLHLAGAFATGGLVGRPLSDQVGEEGRYRLEFPYPVPPV